MWLLFSNHCIRVVWRVVLKLTWTSVYAFLSGRVFYCKDKSVHWYQRRKQSKTGLLLLCSRLRCRWHCRWRCLLCCRWRCRRQSCVVAGFVAGVAACVRVADHDAACAADCIDNYGVNRGVGRIISCKKSKLCLPLREFMKRICCLWYKGKSLYMSS